MNKRYVKITAVIIAVVFALGIIGPLAYVAFSEPYAGEKLGSNDKINSIKADKKTLQAEIKQLSERIEKAEKLLNELKGENSKRFRLMCERGTGSYKDIIFSSENISDMTDRVVIARELLEYDKEVTRAIDEIKSEIESDNAEKENLLKSIEEEDRIEEEKIKEEERIKEEQRIREKQIKETSEAEDNSDDDEDYDTDQDEDDYNYDDNDYDYEEDDE